MLNLKNKNVLIFGGTGSIGENILKKILPFKPKIVRVFSRDEHKQFILQQELKKYKNIRYLIGDIRNYERVQMAVKDIDVIFHTAALKHVPSCEFNPFEAVETNVKGTQNIVNAAIKENVDRVVVISTDKAAGGVNVMGATKLLAERITAAGNFYKGNARTRLSAVRFGNVLGTRGSVLPLFIKQLKEKGMLTLTDPEMTRFMMTIDDAIDLLFNASDIMKGGEIFILKMKTIRMLDFANVIIDILKNKTKMKKKPIKVIGRRPGERRDEILMTTEEVPDAIETKDMFIITPSIALPNRREFKYIYKGQKKPNINEFSSKTAPKWKINDLKRVLMKNI